MIQVNNGTKGLYFFFKNWKTLSKFQIVKQCVKGIHSKYPTGENEQKKSVTNVQGKLLRHGGQ